MRYSSKDVKKKLGCIKLDIRGRYREMNHGQCKQLRSPREEVTFPDWNVENSRL